jgi:hypothetical protein
MSLETPLAASPQELTRHGGTVDGLAARADLCASAVRHVRLDAGAYGQLCAFVPSLLNNVMTSVDAASVGAAEALHSTATLLRHLAWIYAEADGTVDQEFTVPPVGGR